MPQVLDPFFHKSVVLLIRHQEEGSFGLIINRPTDLALSEILNGLDIPWQGSPEGKAFCGGPVQPQLGTVIYRLDAGGDKTDGDDEAHREEAVEGEHTIISPGVAMSQHVGDLAKLSSGGEDCYRLLLGYAQWESGQLAEEILRNDWLTAPVDTGLIFGNAPDDAWESALSSMGIQAGRLPRWTQALDTDGPITH
jgi:putative transcriptional regulator